MPLKTDQGSGPSLSEPAAQESEAAPWPDDDAEASARADALQQGEEVAIAAALDRTDEEPEVAKADLPNLEQLVSRLSPPVRDTLEDLFRARWSRVSRFKKRDLRG